MLPQRRPVHPILRPRQGAALLWLLLALVWAPTLGRMHQAVHGAPQAGHHHAAHAVVPAGGTGLFLFPLLADHTPVDCLLLDQLALADAALGASQALAPTLPAALPAPWRATGTAPRHVALFHARGPPPATRG
jgi:hypothetical protein